MGVGSRGVGLGWGIHYLFKFVLSAWFWAGVCPAGRVGGQATQSGSTRTPSPAVAVVAVVGSTGSGLTPRIYQDSTWEAALATLTTAYWARPTNCAESPKFRTALGWRHPTSTRL